MTVLALLFSLAALVWMIPVIRSGRVPVLASTVLLVGTVLGPTFFAIDGPIQISLDRVLWVGMLAVLAIRWRRGQLSLQKINRVDWMLIALAGWLLVSSTRGGPVPTGSSPTARWLFYIAMPMGMYVACRLTDLRDSDLRLFRRTMVVLGVYLAVTAVCEVSGLHALVYPTFIADSASWEFYGRGRGPLMNPAGNGIVMSILARRGDDGVDRLGPPGKNDLRCTGCRDRVRRVRDADSERLAGCRRRDRRGRDRACATLGSRDGARRRGVDGRRDGVGPEGATGAAETRQASVGCRC